MTMDQVAQFIGWTFMVAGGVLLAIGALCLIGAFVIDRAAWLTRTNRAIVGFMADNVRAGRKPWQGRPNTKEQAHGTR